MPDIFVRGPFRNSHVFSAGSDAVRTNSAAGSHAFSLADVRNRTSRFMPAPPFFPVRMVDYGED
jgi:hypothetical protein